MAKNSRRARQRQAERRQERRDYREEQQDSKRRKQRDRQNRRYEDVEFYGEAEVIPLPVVRPAVAQAMGKKQRNKNRGGRRHASASDIDAIAVAVFGKSGYISGEHIKRVVADQSRNERGPGTTQEPV